MFQDQPKTQSSNLLKFIIPAAVIFAIGVAGLLYMNRSEVRDIPLTGILRAEDPDYAGYSPYVLLTSSKINLGKNFAGQRFVIFSGSIENKGDRTLDVVELKLTLFNYEEPVFEAVRVPFRPGGYPAIKPLSSRSFTLYLEGLPGDWLASHAEMELNGFRFQED
jgi:hypothetical protein